MRKRDTRKLRRKLRSKKVKTSDTSEQELPPATGLEDRLYGALMSTLAVTRMSPEETRSKALAVAKEYEDNRRKRLLRDLKGEG